MDALISGSAGLLAWPKGSAFELIMASDPDHPRQISAAEITAIFGHQFDAVTVKYNKRSEALREMITRRDCDLCLRILQAYFRAPQDSQEKKRAYCEILEANLENIDVLTRVENIVFSVCAVIRGQPDGYDDLPISSRLIELLHKMQDQIRLVRSTFDEFVPNIIEDRGLLCEWEANSIERGVFRSFVKALHSNSGTASSIFQAYKTLGDQPSYREVISGWTKSWATKGKSARPTEVKGDRSRGATYRPPVRVASGREQFVSATKQIESVEGQLEKGELDRARLFTSQLVERQLQGEQGAFFATKSLCNLAQAAKRLGHQDLQVEWLSTALRISPDDAWTNAQAADALLTLNKFQDAERLFGRAATLGEELFGLCGLGRLYRTSGHPDKALESFRAAKERFPDDPEAAWAWVGEAETLRDKWMLEDALDVYKDLGEKFDQIALGWSGYASVLKDTGQLVEAESEYRRLKTIHPHDAYVICGLADVLRLKGEFAEAMELYKQANVNDPSDPVPLCGQADTLRSMNEHEAALVLFQEIAERFQYNPRGYEGVAQAFKELGQIDKALAYYETALSKFKFDRRMRNGYAQMLAFGKRRTEALQAFDLNVADFPYDLVAATGRAYTLKLLGYFNESVDAYRKVLQLRPTYVKASYALASVLIILKRYPEANELLGNGEDPQSLTDWHGYHIRATMMLKQGAIADAISMLKDGVEKSPFYKARQQLNLSLATALLAQNKAAEAHHYLDDKRLPMAMLLSVHALGLLGRTRDAKSCLEAVNDNEIGSSVLKDELAARFGLRAARSRFSDGWVIDQETNLILRAA